jgi:hypothetical protein
MLADISIKFAGYFVRVGKFTSSMLTPLQLPTGCRTNLMYITTVRPAHIFIMLIIRTGPAYLSWCCHLN